MQSHIKIGKQITDWFGGIHYPLASKTKNWDIYRPVHETQNRNGETWGCTVFNGLDMYEALFMYDLKNNLVPPELVKWLTENGYFIDGFINFSDAYTYQKAGITPGVGTYIYQAQDAMREGLVPESKYTYEDYFINKKPITDELEKLAEEFKKRFILNWYWV